ncbi:hypothetical protein C7377_0231 [Balneicella halophila]|uniref:Enoyl reductase (ER) domain-containing protein n=1 Tax=Balneicella halophila TaxID=1537566 RepID=A0A7L4URU2_BALHA|nr:NADP-dependent oxidoreductase [Balneicella halophila]PVX51937.1 hypothetical protein C7377_0231 [Balneicella halophila]
MKALLITGYGDVKDNLKFSQIDKPKIKENQVLVEVYAASTNPVDYKIIKGELKPIKKLDFPARIGYDVAGVVVEKGANVKDFNVGDEIFSRVSGMSPGTFAEFVAIDSELVCPKPKQLSLSGAASLPLVGVTTIQVFNEAHLKKGDKVLIHAGSGGIGTFAIQYAKSKGAYVYTTTSTKNVDWVKELGADRVIDYKKENYLDIAKEVDVVYDTLGDDYTYDAFKAIKKGGKVITLVGVMDKESAKELGLNWFYRFILSLKRIKINKEIKRKSAHYKFILMEPNKEQICEIKKLADDGFIKPVIDREYPFSEAIEALQYQKTGRAKGKIIIKVKE